MSTDQVLVHVPARPDFVAILRAVVGSVAARAGMRFDEIEDLKLAADEMCAQLLGTGTPDTTLMFRIAPDTDELEMQATIEYDGVAWPPAEIEKSLGWQILTALVDHAEAPRDGAFPSLRVTKRRPTS